MALIIRIDVDRPYGKHPVWRHVLSRLASDFYLPRIEAAGYLRELGAILQLLNERKARAYVFFRACTLPSAEIMRLVGEGGHHVGLHLENSRSFETFQVEHARLERHVGTSVACFSKHGSGGRRYGRRHFAPYEPEKYADWGRRAGMMLFLGNGEDPTLAPHDAGGFVVFPSAFWLEPAWRDAQRFSVEWLSEEATHRDVVLLIHPENVLESPTLIAQFVRLVALVPSRTVKSASVPALTTPASLPWNSWI